MESLPLKSEPSKLQLIFSYLINFFTGGAKCRCDQCNCSSSFNESRPALPEFRPRGAGKDTVGSARNEDLRGLPRGKPTKEEQEKRNQELTKAKKEKREMEKAKEEEARKSLKGKPEGEDNVDSEGKAKSEKDSKAPVPPPSKTATKSKAGK